MSPQTDETVEEKQLAEDSWMKTHRKYELFNLSDTNDPATFLFSTSSGK